MAIVRILIGIPGSGKSSYAAELHKNGWVVNSSDVIREELYGTANEQSHNNEIFNTMYRRTVNGIVAGFNVCYDATNLSSKRRAALVKNFKSNKSIPSNTRYEAVVIATPFEECVRRNYNRERRVPYKVILSMMKRFEMPAKWEGFDEIRVYGNEDPNGIINFGEILKACDHLEHDNPHHTLNVGSHMRKAATLYLESKEAFDEILLRTLRCHDVGKYYCKTFVNSHGETTDIAHYYNHNNVGAYLYLSLNSIANINGTMRPEDLEIVYLIQHHMCHFFKGQPEKIKERFGEKFYKKLELVHKYDIASH